MHDIANTDKHSKTTRPKATIKEAREHKGVYSSVYSGAYDISGLEIEMEDGTVLYFPHEIKKVVDFWKDYFKNELGK